MQKIMAALGRSCAEMLGNLLRKNTKIIAYAIGRFAAGAQSVSRRKQLGDNIEHGAKNPQFLSLLSSIYKRAKL